jgi:hypothetical protein
MRILTLQLSPESIVILKKSKWFLAFCEVTVTALRLEKILKVESQLKEGKKVGPVETIISYFIAQ